MKQKPWQPSEATVADLPQLCDLLAALFSQEAEFNANRELQMAGLRLILETPSAGRVFVLRDGGRVVGMVNLLVTISTFLGGKAIGLEDLIVHRDYRGRGGATALLEFASQFAKLNGAKRITLLTDPANEPAIRLYQKHGFVASDMRVMRWME